MLKKKAARSGQAADGPGPKCRDPSTSPTRPLIDVLDNQMEQLADELERRKATSRPPTAAKPSAAAVAAATSAASSSASAAMNTKRPVTRQQSAPINAADADDPGQMLNVWLGELEAIQKGLSDYRMTPTPMGYHSRESSATPVHMRRMSTPRVESPRLDSYRYSLINLEETLEHDLDAILGELCALESNFDLRRTPPRHTTAMTGLSSLAADNDTPTDLPPPPAPLQLQLEDLLASEPQYISPESVRQAKMMAKRTDSPDADSAFCENTSSRSSGSSNNTATFKHPSSLGLHPSSRKTSQESAKSCSSSASTTSSSASASTTTTNTALLLSPSDPQDAAARAKAEKIRLAIEKIKEASVKKIFIKVFGEDGSAKSLLVDERMTVAKVCRMLADKNYVKRDTSWGLVELLPDLHMERAYEDHEMLVENLLMWKADSKNTLWFIKRPEVYDLFNRPELYLLGDTSSQIGAELDDRARAELIEEYFSSSGVGAPEVEGSLWLKAESKKSWKKFYFVLRTSGLYYAPKGKKTSKDLVCLARFDVNQVYYGVKWQPKFKSPTKHCLAIKHPQIQAKNPKYIRYLCADSEAELNKWVTGIRLAKYGRVLFRNYRSIVEENAHDDLDRLASARNSMGCSSGVGADAILPFDEADSMRSNGADKRPPHHHHHDHPASLHQRRDQTHGAGTTTVLVHSNGQLPSRSSRSSSGSGLAEHGFSCDSPEGGTIKKCPSSAIKSSTPATTPTAATPAAKSSLLSFRPDASTLNRHKEVRFKDTFSLIPSDSPPTSTYATLRRPTPPSSSSSAAYGGSPHSESSSGRLMDDSHRLLLHHLHHVGATLHDQSAANGDDFPLKRRYSTESLVSNPAMLHTGTISRAQELPPPPPPPLELQSQFNGDSPSHQQARVQLSPQPQRPAPVLKPSVSRKPSLDKSVILRKQQQSQPTYEDTIKKCQSLTDTGSALNGPNVAVVPPSLSRQRSDAAPSQDAPKGSPVVPPKPSLATRALTTTAKISHLPPSGLGHRGASVVATSARSSSLNRMPNGARNGDTNNAFITDLENAVSRKHKDSDALILRDDCDGSGDSPFPNRLSSGEYDNVNGKGLSNGGGQSNGNGVANGGVKTRKQPVPPPLPKRNEETRLSWNRS